VSDQVMAERSEEFWLGDGAGEATRLLMKGTVRPFQHTEGSAIILELKTEDQQRGTRTEDLVIMPQMAETLACALLVTLAQMRRVLTETADEQQGSSIGGAWGT